MRHNPCPLAASFGPRTCTTARVVTLLQPLLRGSGRRLLMEGTSANDPATPSACRALPSRSLAPLIDTKKSHSAYVSEKDVQLFFEYYKRDPDIARTDAFVCAFPLSFCEAFLPFNRTVIYLAAHRYVLGRCHTEAQWLRLNKHLAEAAKFGNVVAAMGRFDAEYINYYTGLDPIILSTNSFWYASPPFTNYSSAPRSLLDPCSATQCPLQMSFSGLQKADTLSQRRGSSMAVSSRCRSWRATVRPSCFHMQSCHMASPKCMRLASPCLFLLSSFWSP